MSRRRKPRLAATLAPNSNAPAFHLAGDNETAPLAYSGAPVRVPSITSLEDYQLKLAAASGTKMSGAMYEV